MAAWRMVQAASRPGTSSSARVSSAERTGPVFSARTASATAFRYCGTANLPGSPRPTTSTRGADTPARSCSTTVRPAAPSTSPRAASAARRPPLASSRARAAGVRVLSAQAPTTTQSTAAVAGAAVFRANSRVMGSLCGVWREVFLTIRGPECGNAPRRRRPGATIAVYGRPPILMQGRPGMPKLDTYLFREFAQSTFAALVVLMIVSLGGVFADVLGDIARGRVPAGLMLAQLGLMVLNYLPLILPLGLMLGLLLAVGRLYRDSEMPVLVATGVGPRRLLRPFLMLVLPVVGFIAACS